MKKQDIINKIKKTALDEMPDVLNRINLDSIVIDDIQTKKNPISLRKVFSYTFASLIVLLTGFSIYNFGVVPNITNTTPLESDSEIIGFQTISGTTLIDNIQATELSNTFSTYELQELSQTATEPIEDQLDLINQYMKMTETVIGNQNAFIYEDIESTNPSYQYAFEYRGTDLLGNLITYKGFYNSTESMGYTLYNGIIIHDDVEYRFSNSIKQLEQNMFITCKIETDENNYVEVTNFSNQNLQKFEYKVYVNGHLDNESELILTEKKDQLKAELTLNKNSDDEVTLNIEDDSTKDTNQYQITYQFKNTNQSGEITVNLVENTETGEYQYQYKTETNSFIMNRDVKSNGKASDEDFQPGNTNNGNGKNETEITTTTEEESPGNGSYNNDSTSNPDPGSGPGGSSKPTKLVPDSIPLTI
ncbi:hypothetical protein ACAG96_02590 [Candidatus Izemoplasma sp. B36]|uniref:hypothetical protein n=1 Tax=Candidatus Izemoplasma sp. B36 TaxID=3242468 RepID=UPI0035583C3D